MRHGLCDGFHQQTPYNIKKSVDFLVNKILNTKHIQKQDNIKRLTHIVYVFVVFQNVIEIIKIMMDYYKMSMEYETR